MDGTMDEKLSVSELLEYYIRRYCLPTENRSDLNAKADDGMRTYNAAITRIIQSVPVGEITLWDAIKPDMGPRRISVAEFERHCFGQWAKYVEKNCETYDAGLLRTDRERLRLYEEDEYWAERAREADEARDRALESGYVPGYVPDGEEPLDTEVEKRMHDMMLEAVYSAMYEGFDRERLRADIELTGPSSCSGYGEETPGEVAKAKYRLQSFLNYIGKRKS